MAAYAYQSPGLVVWSAHWSNTGVAAALGDNYPALTQEFKYGEFTTNASTYSDTIPLFVVPPGFVYSLNGIFQLINKAGASGGDQFATYIKHTTDAAKSQSFLNVAVFQLTSGTALSSVNYSITNPTHELSAEIIRSASPFYTTDSAGAPVIAVHYELTMWRYV